LNAYEKNSNLDIRQRNKPLQNLTKRQKYSNRSKSRLPMHISPSIWMQKTINPETDTKQCKVEALVVDHLKGFGADHVYI